MESRQIVDRIQHYNQNREEERLALKYQRMAIDPFVFFRGTCHLFYEDLPLEGVFTDAPVAWICGDLHLENFGSYKGDNQLAYFDLNDFDESALAPLTWELARFLTSLWLAADQLGVKPKETALLERQFIEAYTGELLQGKARWVERDTATGMVDDVLSSIQSRKAFLDERTRRNKNDQPRLKLIPDKTLPIEPGMEEKLADFLKTFGRTQEQKRLFRFIDAARRIAGTGSLGIRRYVLLTEGEGPPNGYFLLDFKQALPSSLAPRLSTPQPAWANEALRVVTIQRRVQAIEPALLQAVDFDHTSWVLRQLQPSQNRLQLAQSGRQAARLRQTVQTMGQVLAWAHLRSSGRQGSANADLLEAFARTTDWPDQLVDYARYYSAQVTADWHDFHTWWESSKR